MIKILQTVFLNPFGYWPFLFNFAILIIFVGILWFLLNFKNFLVTLLCIELMYFGVVVFFILTSLAFDNPEGQIYALLSVILAASESAIGLGILIVLYRFGGTIDVTAYEKLSR